MSLPTEDEQAFITLERSFRDLVWSAVDAKRAEDSEDADKLMACADTVRGRMERVHPERYAKFKFRLTHHLKLVADGADELLMRPKVVNRHHYRTDGKPDSDKLPRPYIYIGRGTALGNPFKVKDHGTKAYDYYRTHLWTKIKERDPKVLRALAEISWDMHLVCSCTPNPCHGDLVVLAWTWLQRQPWWSPEQFRQ